MMVWKRGQQEVFKSQSSQTEQFFSQFTDVHIQYSMKLGLYWYQVGKETCYTQKASKFCVEKDICINKLENVYFMDQKTMPGGLWSFWNANW